MFAKLKCQILNIRISETQIYSLFVKFKIQYFFLLNRSFDLVLFQSLLRMKRNDWNFGETSKTLDYLLDITKHGLIKRADHCSIRFQNLPILL